MKYPMLGDYFCDWFEEEYNRVYSEYFGDGIPQSLLDELKMTSKEYFDKFIMPYLSLTKEQLLTTLDFLVLRLKDRLTPQPSPYCLSYKLSVNPKINALEWLLVHVADLKYFEFNDFVKSKYEKPYLQCLVCGKPDYYEITTPRGKKEQRYFSHKKKYCHRYECVEDNPNPQEHVIGCHYKEWAYIKKSMNQKLSRAYKRLEKIEKIKENNLATFDDIDTKLEQAINEFYGIFEDFYLEQYKKNCNILYTIRTSKDDEVFDLREFSNDNSFLKLN